MTLPWQDYWEALGELEDAGRAGDPAAEEAAKGRVRLCREECALLGAFLITLAIEEPSQLVVRRLQAAFAGAGKAAWRRANAAADRATWAAAKADALERRVRELEARLEGQSRGAA